MSDPQPAGTSAANFQRDRWLLHQQSIPDDFTQTELLRVLVGLANRQHEQLQTIRQWLGWAIFMIFVMMALVALAVFGGLTLQFELA